MRGKLFHVVNAWYIIKDAPRNSSFSFLCLFLFVCLSDLQPRMCLTRWTAAIRSPAGPPADCRIEKATGVELNSEGEGRENQNRDSRASRAKRRWVCQETVLFCCWFVRWCCCIEENTHRCCSYTTPVFTCILLLCSCHTWQERGALWSALIFYLNWMESLSVKRQTPTSSSWLWPAQRCLQRVFFFFYKEIFSGMLQQASISVNVWYQLSHTDRWSFVNVPHVYPLPAIELQLFPFITKPTAVPSCFFL